MVRALVVLLLALPLTGLGQERDDVGEPDPPRVRLAIDKAGLPKRLVGELVDESPWTLTVRADGRDVVVDRTAVRRLDVSLGERTPEAGMLRGAARGFVIGAVVGVAAGIAAGNDEQRVRDCSIGDADCTIPLRLTASEKALIGGGAFGLLGGIFGGTIGAGWPGDVWQRRVPGGPLLALRLQPRAFGAQLAIRF